MVVDEGHDNRKQVLDTLDFYEIEEHNLLTLLKAAVDARDIGEASGSLPDCW